jgi:hypothetical protein
LNDDIRGLSLTQPWATLIALGVKRVETRSWRTHYRGPILVHAARSMPVDRGQALSFGRWVVDRDPSGSLWLSNRDTVFGIRSAQALPISAVLAVVDVVDVVSTDDPALEIHPDEHALGDYSPGRFAWVLDNLRPLAFPVPAAGRLGLWRPDSKLVAAVERAITTTERTNA